GSQASPVGKGMACDLLEHYATAGTDRAPSRKSAQSSQTTLESRAHTGGRTMRRRASGEGSTRWNSQEHTRTLLFTQGPGEIHVPSHDPLRSVEHPEREELARGNGGQPVHQ